MPETFRFGFPLEACSKEHFLLVLVPEFQQTAKRHYPGVEFDEGKYKAEDGRHILICKPKPAPARA